MIRELHLSILTPKTLASRDCAMEILDLLCNLYPDIMPERYGSYEPLRTIFDQAHPEEWLDTWDESDLIFWQRRKPKLLGSVSIIRRGIPQHAWITLSIDAEKANVQHLVEFIKTASSQLCADFSCLHLLTESEVPYAQATGAGFCLDPKRGRYSLTVSTFDLRKYLPDIYWATVFGPAYIKHFGKERILSAPAPVIYELNNDCIYMQLSESPFDLESDFARVDEVRQNIKKHLNMNSFFIRYAPEDQVYNVPEFILEKKEHKLNERDELLRRSKIEANDQDDFSESNLNNMIASTVQDAISTAKEYYNIDLDYSDESIKQIESILSDIHKDIDQKYTDDIIATLSVLWGSYLGETLRKKFGGKWRWDISNPSRPVVALDTKRARLNPITKVHHRLTDGEVDDVWFYFKAVCELLEKNKKTSD